MNGVTGIGIVWLCLTKQNELGNPIKVGKQTGSSIILETSDERVPLDAVSFKKNVTRLYQETFGLEIHLDVHELPTWESNNAIEVPQQAGDKEKFINSFEHLLKKISLYGYSKDDKNTFGFICELLEEIKDVELLDKVKDVEMDEVSSSLSIGENLDVKEDNFIKDMLNRYNFILVLLVTAFILIGLATGLIAFFTLQGKSKRAAKTALERYAQTQADILQKELDKSVLVAINIKGLFEVDPLVQYSSFEAFINTTEVRTRNPGINTIAYCPQIKQADITSAQNEIRTSLDSRYENFTIFDMDNSFNHIPLRSMPLYTPLLFSDPFVDFLIGYDIGASVAFKLDAIDRARVSKQSAATSKTFFTVPGLGERPVCEMYCPVIKNGEITGFSGVSFFISTMVDAAFSDYVLSRVDVLLMDDDISDEKSDAHYLHSTTGALTYAASQKSINKVPFTASQTVFMADRQWRAVFLPTNTFLRTNEGYEKWIGLFVPLAVCVILSFVLALLIKGSEYSAKMREMARERVIILETAQRRLQNLLDSIATQEKKTRIIINTLTDAVIVTDEHGKLLKINNSFEKMFGMNEVDIHNNSLQNIFVEDDIRIMLVDNPIGIDTQAKNQFGKTFPVQVFSQSLSKQHGAEEAFVLSVRNMSDKEKMLRDLAGQKDKIKNLEEKAEFDSQFAVESFRKELLEFCTREINSENVEFLIALLEYKSLPFNLRAERKVVIFNKFLKIGAQKQLNISKEISDRIEHKVKKSKTADTDLFEHVEDIVKGMIIPDSYPRFKKYQEKNRKTPTDSSSSEDRT